jgi:hypothetical protein
MRTQYFLSMILIATCIAFYIPDRPHACFGKSALECAWYRFPRIPQGYGVHVSEVLMRYAPDKNQATPAQYHVSGHNISLNISHSYGSGIGNDCRHIVQRLPAHLFCTMIASQVVRGGQPLRCRCRSNVTNVVLLLPYRHKPMCGDAPTSYQQSCHNPSVTPS